MNIKTLITMLITACFHPGYGQGESFYYSKTLYDTSSVVYNNYITAIQYDSVHHRLYTSMTSFNNYFPDDPRPRMYSQLLIHDPDNGEVLKSYIDTFSEHYVHSYEICTLIDSFIYWSGYMYDDSTHPCSKSNTVLLKTDKELNPLWRIVFDYEYKMSQYGGGVYTLDDEGNIMYIFSVNTYSGDTCFSTSGAYNVICHIDRYGHVYKDTVLTNEAYYYHRAHVLAKKDNGHFWSAGRYNNIPGSYPNNFIQLLDTNFHIESPIFMDWFFYECYLRDVHRSHGDSEAYYISGFKWDGGSSYSKGLNMKMDAEGSPIWFYIQEGETVRSEFFMSALTPEDEMVMLGYGTMDMENDPKSHGIVYKLNSEGDLQWMREIKETEDPAEHEYLYYFVVLPNGDMIATGHTNGFDSTVMRRRQYGWLVRIDGHGCQEPGCELLSTEPDIERANFSIYPNPSEDGVFYLTFEHSASGDTEIEVYNTLGQSIYKTDVSASSEIRIDISGFAKGIYYISLKTSQGQSIKKVVHK